ncbi:hypothetical protein [Cellulomonas sp. P5_C5]
MTGRPLQGKWQDLLSTGVPLNGLTRQAVVKATRQVMLAMHRAGWSRTEMMLRLGDPRSGGLADQIATGRGGIRMAPGVRLTYLARHWDETAQLAAKPPRDRSATLDWLEHVREALTADSSVSDRHRAVLEVALALASEYGTGTPVLPVRVVAARTGLTVPTAQRTIAAIADQGIWLVRSTQGDHRTRRASTYTLAPGLQALQVTHVGATPPESHPVPTSHPPMSHSERRPTTLTGAPTMADQITLTLSPDERAAVLQTLAAMRATSEAPAPVADNVLPFPGSAVAR